jgi:hypothetical protein
MSGWVMIQRLSREYYEDCNMYRHIPPCGRRAEGEELLYGQVSCRLTVIFRRKLVLSERSGKHAYIRLLYPLLRKTSLLSLSHHHLVSFGVTILVLTTPKIG